MVDALDLGSSRVIPCESSSLSTCTIMRIIYYCVFWGVCGRAVYVLDCESRSREFESRQAPQSTF